MKAIITGGCGFLGAHLATRLQSDGWRVDLADNFSRGVRDSDLQALLNRPGLRLIERDLLDPAALETEGSDYDRVYHFAAIVGVQNVLDKPYEVLRQNMVLLSNAIDFARRQKNLGRFVFASTSEVYAGTSQHFALPIPTPESVPLALPDLRHPRTSYMLSKVYGEALCLQSGLAVTVVRPHNVYGPRMGLSHVIPELLKKAHEARGCGNIEVFSADHRRTFCYVDDAIELIVRASGSPQCAGEVINVGHQAPEIAMGELACMIIKIVGKPLKIVPRPATPGSPVRRCPDMARALKLTGYRARVPLDEGIRRTYEWYREWVFEPQGPRAC